MAQFNASFKKACEDAKAKNWDIVNALVDAGATVLVDRTNKIRFPNGVRALIQWQAISPSAPFELVYLGRYTEPLWETLQHFESLERLLGWMTPGGYQEAIARVDYSGGPPPDELTRLQ